MQSSTPPEDIQRQTAGEFWETLDTSGRGDPSSKTRRLRATLNATTILAVCIVVACIVTAGVFFAVNYMPPPLDELPPARATGHNAEYITRIPSGRRLTIDEQWSRRAIVRKTITVPRGWRIEAILGPVVNSDGGSGWLGWYEDGTPMCTRRLNANWVGPPLPNNKDLPRGNLIWRAAVRPADATELEVITRGPRSYDTDVFKTIAGRHLAIDGAQRLLGTIEYHRLYDDGILPFVSHLASADCLLYRLVVSELNDDQNWSIEVLPASDPSSRDVRGWAAAYALRIAGNDARSIVVVAREAGANPLRFVKDLVTLDDVPKEWIDEAVVEWKSTEFGRDRRRRVTTAADIVKLLCRYDLREALTFAYDVTGPHGEERISGLARDVVVRSIAYHFGLRSLNPPRSPLKKMTDADIETIRVFTNAHPGVFSDRLRVYLGLKQ